MADKITPQLAIRQPFWQADGAPGEDPKYENGDYYFDIISNKRYERRNNAWVEVELGGIKRGTEVLVDCGEIMTPNENVLIDAGTITS